MIEPSVNLSVVIPAFNEAHVLESSLAQLARVVDPLRTELVIVDDGSTDDTATSAAVLLCGWPHGKLVEFASNRGKGAAVRAGVALTTADAVLFCDADMSTPPSTIESALGLLDRYDVVIGSRSVPGSVVRRSTVLRTMMGRTFNSLMRAVIRVPVSDSQCGFKMFRGSVARSLFAASTINRFAFDAEILRLAYREGYLVHELPVVWTAGEKSSVRPVRDSLLTAVELARVRIVTRGGAAGAVPATSRQSHESNAHVTLGPRRS